MPVAWRKPVRSAAPLPRFTGWYTTRSGGRDAGHDAAISRRASRVPSREQSSTTMISWTIGTSATRRRIWAIVEISLKHGITTLNGRGVVVTANIISSYRPKSVAGPLLVAPKGACFPPRGRGARLTLARVAEKCVSSPPHYHQESGRRRMRAHGLRHRPSLRPERPSDDRPGDQRGGPQEGHGPHSRIPGRRRETGQSDRGSGGIDPEQPRGHHLPGGSERLRPGHRSGRRKPRREAQGVFGTRPRLQDVHDLRLEHLEHLDHGPGGGNEANGPVHRASLH